MAQTKIATAALAVALLAAACGGTGSVSDTEAAPATTEASAPADTEPPAPPTAIGPRGGDLEFRVTEVLELEPDNALGEGSVYLQAKVAVTNISDGGNRFPSTAQRLLVGDKEIRVRASDTGARAIEDGETREVYLVFEAPIGWRAMNPRLEMRDGLFSDGVVLPLPAAMFPSPTAATTTTATTEESLTATSPVTTATAATTTTTATEPVPDVPVLEAGTHEVGVGIQPGIYRLYSPSGYSFYWERLSGFGGELDDIIANGIHHRLVIEVGAGDVGFKVDEDVLLAETYLGITDSEELNLFISEITDSRELNLLTSFGGSYVLEVGEGKDLAPGTYRLEGSCYWKRLSGFGGGDIDDVIANDNVDGKFIVEIKPSDAGFDLSCWPKPEEGAVLPPPSSMPYATERKQ